MNTAFLKKIPYTKIAVVGILLLLPLAYWYGRSILIDQSTSFSVVLSNFSVNFFLFLVLFGRLLDKKLAHLPRWKNWLVWGLCMLIMTLVFKFIFGWDTTWDAIW